MKRLAAIGFARALAGPARSEDVIIMVGESTTWGLRSDKTQTPLNAAATLESLLAQAPGCAFGGLRVENWAVSATNTKEWFLERPDAFCAPRGRHPLVDHACDNDLPLALAVEPLAAQLGLTIRAVVVNAQGTNDAHFRDLTPLRTAAHIARWSSVVTAPVFVSPPFNRNDPRDSVVVQLSGRSPRYLARYVQRVRRAELARGILTGPDWGILMPNPTFQSDGFHLMDGAYAAAGTFWFDVLCPSP